jgi:ribosomal subunit interface protein
MALRISGKNINMGEALRSHVRTRIDLAVSKFSAGPVTGHVTIEPEGSGFRTDCTLHLQSGMTLQVEAESHEPYASFNRAADRVEERLRRYKRRIRNKHGTHDIPQGIEVNAPLPEDIAEFNIGALGEAGPAVIAEPQPRLREMTVSSAVLELDLSNVPVVIFRHAGDGRPSIVYRRADGNIGWIDSISA